MLDTLGALPARQRHAILAAMPNLATNHAQTAKQPAKYERKLRVTAKVRAAISAMVWQGLKRSEAAQSAGLTDHSLYVALRSPHVKAHYLAECEVLRVSGRARRIHRLESMVEQDENKAAVVNAVRALELMGEDEVVSRASQGAPGMVIVIQGNASLMAHERHLDAKPLIDNARVQIDE